MRAAVIAAILVCSIPVLIIAERLTKVLDNSNKIDKTTRQGKARLNIHFSNRTVNPLLARRSGKACM